VKGKRRFTWILLSQNARVADLRDGVLELAMSNPGARDSFGRGGSEDILREALIVVLGADLRIQIAVDSGSTPTGAGAVISRPGSDPAVADRSNEVEVVLDERDAAATLDDSTVDTTPESHADLLARHLGAEIIAEEENDAHGR
jgi:DNA polymerase-3 subunit gamma/tau